MKYISCRKNFDDVNDFADKNAAYYGDPYMGPNELIQVHGYNSHAVNVEDAYRSNKEIYAEMGGKRNVTGFLWPGLGENIVESLQFHKAQKYALSSAGFFASYINNANIVGTPVVVTHSLGAQVVLDALLNYGAQIKCLALTGPAVEANCLTTKYKSVLSKVERILVFWSSHDPVLARAFQLDQMKTALGHSGPTTGAPNIFSFDLSSTVYQHSDYRYSRAMWQQIAETI